MVAEEKHRNRKRPRKQNKKKKHAEKETVQEEAEKESKEGTQKIKKKAVADEEEEEPPQKKQKKTKKHADEETVQEEAEKESKEGTQKIKKKAVADEETSKEPSKRAAEDDQIYKAFVSGLPFTTTEPMLKKDFEECGTISELRIATDKETGRSRGFAFITFETAEGLAAAIKYDGTDYGGRSITVKKADAKDSTGTSKDGKGKGKGKDSKDATNTIPSPGEKPDGCTSVVVKGLSFEATGAQLEKLFAACGGGPTNVKLVTDRATGKSKGMAFVDFDDEVAVDEAMKLTGTEFHGRAFYMCYANPR